MRVLFYSGESIVKCLCSRRLCVSHIRNNYLFIMGWTRVRRVCLWSVSSMVL